MLHLRDRLRAARAADDAGFTLVEVVVAAVILGIAAALSLTLVVAGLGTVKTTTQRSTAAALAAAQIEKVAGLPVTSIADGETTAATTTVSGTTYTVVQDASYLPLASDTTACASNGSLAYKRVTETVTWTSMGSTKPVTTSTLRALGLSDTAAMATKGSIAVLVSTAASAADSGIPVTLTSASGVVAATLTTGSDGCVVFAGLTPGSFTASVGQVGYVGANSLQAVSATAVATAGALSSAPTLLYDKPGALSVSLSTSATTVPAFGALTLKNSSVFAAPYLRQITGLSASRPWTVSSLLPSTAYQVAVGTCADALSTSTPNTVVSASTTSALSVPTATVTVTTGSAAAAGTAYYAVHASDTSCTSGETYALGSLPANAASTTVALPYGTWYLQRTSSVTSLQTSQKAVVSAGAPTATVTVSS